MLVRVKKIPTGKKLDEIQNITCKVIDLKERGAEPIIKIYNGDWRSILQLEREGFKIESIDQYPVLTWLFGLCRELVTVRSSTTESPAEFRRG